MLELEKRLKIGDKIYFKQKQLLLRVIKKHCFFVGVGYQTGKFLKIELESGKELFLQTR